MSVLIRWLAGGKGLVVGWASIIIVVSFLSGINMIMTGIMGLYVGRIHGEVKRRPLYVLSEKSGFDRAAGCHAPLEGERQRFAAGGVG